MITGRSLLTGIAVVVLSAGMALNATAKNKTEKEIPFDQLPANVQSVINNNLNGGKIVKVESETKKGAEVYEVKVDQNGKKSEFKVSQDGKILAKEKDEADEANEKDEADEKDEKEGGKETVVASVNDLPAAVQSAAKKMIGDGTITKITHETEDGAAQYEVEYTSAGVADSVNLSETGEVMEQEIGVAPGDLPAAVRSALQKKFPDATVSSATSVQKFGYEVTITVNGKSHEVKVSPAGVIKGNHHEGREGKWKKEKDEKNESHEGKTEKASEENDND